MDGDIARRLESLEIKASFMEDLLDQLNLTIYQQQQLIDRLAQEVIQLRRQMPEAGQGGPRNLPCELMPSLVMGPVQSYCRAWLSGQGGADGLPSPATYRAELADAAWRAVRV